MVDEMGGRYTCGGCGNTYLNPHDAVACCSNQPGLMVPKTEPIDDSAEEGYEEVIKDQENQSSR